MVEKNPKKMVEVKKYQKQNEKEFGRSPKKIVSRYYVRNNNNHSEKMGD